MRSTARRWPPGCAACLPSSYGTRKRTRCTARAIFSASSRSIIPRPTRASCCSAPRSKACLSTPLPPRGQRRGLRPYLTFQYSAMNETFFKGTYKLPPATGSPTGTARCRSSATGMSISATPRRSPTRPPPMRSMPRAGERGRHRISDVKLGAFLSGGVDSSYITACLMPDETFSVGFASPDARINLTRPPSGRAEPEARHQELPRDADERAVPRRLRRHPVPHGRAPVQPVQRAALLPVPAARQHVTVVLSGEGADEIYAGYEWYADTPLMQKYKHIPAPLRHLASDASQHLPTSRGTTSSSRQRPPRGLVHRPGARLEEKDPTTF